MKFDFELIKELHGCNPDGTKFILSEGDEVYLKLDLVHMKLYDNEEWIQKHPDGWIKGRIFNISPTGQKIDFYVGHGTYFSLRHKHILAVSDKKPN
jgi:hypothetical protein